MIRGISNFDVSFMYSNPAKTQDASAQQLDKKAKSPQGVKMAQNVAAGAGAVAVLGAGAYYCASSKKANNVLDIAENVGDKLAKVIKKTSEKWISHLDKTDKDKGILNFVVFDRFKFNKQVKSEGYKPLNAYMKGGLERHINISRADGVNATVQDFLTPSKLVHQRTVYRGDEITRYDFAYDNGKPVGYAKEVIQRGTETYVEPLQVKMFDGREINEKYIDDLYEKVPEFNPEKIG